MIINVALTFYGPRRLASLPVSPYNLTVIRNPTDWLCNFDRTPVVVGLYFIVGGAWALGDPSAVTLM